MHRGLYLRKKDQCINEVFQNDIASLALLAKGDNTEVMLQNIKEGEVFCIEPSGEENIFEFFYILDGKIICDDKYNKMQLGKKDYFYVDDLKEPIHFKVVLDVTLLYVSSKQVFSYLNHVIMELSIIMKKIDEKDHYTYGHCNRVKDCSLKIAHKLQLSTHKKEIIGFSALFHDIGKINVPDSILNKPSRLTDYEQEIIKKHPLDSRAMVEDTCYENTAKIIEQHHERLDGSGYPYGLKEDEILLEAKIISIADCYDAMITDRPYKKGKSPLDAIQELQELSAKFYDKEVVNALEEVLKEENIIQF